MKQKQAFTLSEVLLVLSVIGVVSALTIPTLIQGISNEQYKSAYKKAFAVASQSWMKVIAENPSAYTVSGGENPCGNPTDGRWNAFKSKFNIIRECANQTGCWATNAEAWGWQNTSLYGFVTADGMYWTAAYYGIDESHISVDINGEKGPNLWGKDMYQFLLGTSTVHPAMGYSPATAIDGVCQKAGAEPQTINGRSVYFTKPLYE